MTISVRSYGRIWQVLFGSLQIRISNSDYKNSFFLDFSTVDHSARLLELT